VPSPIIFDFDDDGVAEIALTVNSDLIIGNLREGHWNERGRLPGCRLWTTARPVRPQQDGERFYLAQQPIAIGAGNKRRWIATRVSTDQGRPDTLLLLDAKPNTDFTVAEHPLNSATNLQLHAATADRLIVSTAAGKLGVMDLDGTIHAEWECGMPFISQPAVADCDGDGRNEVIVCRADGTIAALQFAGDRQQQPKELWEADGNGLATSLPSPNPTPLVADVDGNGKKEVLVVDNGTRLLNSRGETIWRSDIAASRATFGDFNGDGHLDVYVAAWQPLNGSIGTTTQSFALDGRDGAVLWRNDGSHKAVWHHQLGPLHRLPTIADVNADGCDDVLFLAMDLLVELNGKDGSFLYEPRRFRSTSTAMESRRFCWLPVGDSGAHGRWTESCYGHLIPTRRSWHNVTLELQMWTATVSSRSE
jgi:hypothetical protein